MTKRIVVFPDTGLQKQFIPLVKPETFIMPADAPASLRNAVAEIEEFSKEIPPQTVSKMVEDSKSDVGPYRDLCSFVRWRLGTKVWKLQNGTYLTLAGIWLLVETNTASDDGNRHGGTPHYDRGYVIDRSDLNREQKDEMIKAYVEGRNVSGGDSLYQTLPEGGTMTLPLAKTGYDFGPVEFSLVMRHAAGEARDVDLILDLGNTRTAGLLFEHLPDSVFPVGNFSKQFKILKLDADPSSGEYDETDDVASGITSSWMMLHEPEHGTYLRDSDPKVPSHVQHEYTDVNVTKRESGLLFKKTEYDVSGNVIKRVPQMFQTISPVVLGEGARREFNRVYAKNMVAAGANVQQSSPKRYYWDDQPTTDDWHMLLNEWDPSYDASPASAAYLPSLQGEMLRFVRHDGKILDFKQEIAAADWPDAYPNSPRYPRQSTLTWFILHILERAYEQSQTAFASGAQFIPHRLRKVLMTYPSGWSDDEVMRYRKRCQEALDIFSETHVYHGLKSDLRLEMVKSAQSPDEAVAGQLPFLFSEIIRYPGQTAEEWFRIAGKQRGDKTTLRVMNFDVGGGTTDISILEYEDRNAAHRVRLNDISTQLLFKDGQTVAGDDLLKKVIEKFIIGSLIEQKVGVMIPGETMSLDELIRSRFTEPGKNFSADALRSRIVRTCLIPLAIHCLALSGMPSVRFSAQDAGINKNNWDEFTAFLGASAALSFTQKYFVFNSDEFNAMIEALFSRLFENCAIYATAYDIDLFVCSGKTSELPHFRTMAERILPVDENRMIFAKSFKPGGWYPFTDERGFIQDAKSVTVVGAALYYALANGSIQNWRISSEPNQKPGRNEWGEIEMMSADPEKGVFLQLDEETTVVEMVPNTVIARRRNAKCAPEPVYSFTADKGNDYRIYSVELRRKTSDFGDSLELVSVDAAAPTGFQLKLKPTTQAGDFWQETGIFDL